MMAEKRGMKALELWCRRVTEGYPGVKIENMTTSWRDGLAFCALIHHFRPDLIDFDRLDKRDIYKNNELAFRVAERQLGIPALLDAEDMVEYEVPDRLSILTYLSQFYQTFVSNQQGASSPSSRSHTNKVSEIISPSTKSQKTPKVAAGRLESCWSCRRPVFLAERLVAGGKLRHRTCFTCKRCGNQLNPVGYYETEDNDFVCETCPDEERQLEIGSRREFFKDESDGHVEVKDDYSLDFESAVESMYQYQKDDSKSKFLKDLVENSEFSADSQRTMPNSDTETAEVVFRSDTRSGKKSPHESVSNDQHSTASIENLNVKIKNLLGRDFSDTLSLLNKESDGFIADISEIIDNIINDAVKKAESRVEKSLDDKSSLPHEEVKQNVEIKLNDTTTVNDVDVSNEINEETTSDTKKSEPDAVKPASDVKSDSYPKGLNPFGDEEEEEEEEEKEEEEVESVKPVATPRKTPVPATRAKTLQLNQSGQKIIEAPKVNLNPFWSEGEPSSDEDVKPVPAPRASLRQPEQDSSLNRSQYGSFTSLNSIGSSASVLRRKKGPAPLPPSGSKSLQYPECVEYRSLSPTPSVRSHRKSKPAPPPPILKLGENELVAEKKEKDYENKVKQNLSFHDKSTHGKWKRKKGQAPGLPVPQRRRITPLPWPVINRELEDLEIQQRELERQGVSIEQTIRTYEAEAEDKDDIGGKDVEGLILQLFEIVNQKNELFRRQAELMLLRRQQRLEEEHADIEYQIRCLMGRPERNKTDSDKAQEEELIRKLVEVVERRNEIIECLDMDRKREVEEDESIHHHLEAFAADKTGLTTEKQKPNLKSSPSLLKYMRKKKLKKGKEPGEKTRKDLDKDFDEGNKEESERTAKARRKWFPKP